MVSTGAREVKPHCVSIYLPQDLRIHFEYQGPWWISGQRIDGCLTLLAWVMAESEASAIETIRCAIDEEVRPEQVELRFVDVDEKFEGPKRGGRFPGSPWMRWPWPAVTLGDVVPLER